MKLLLALALVLASPALAQQRLVVPDGATVVIPPRGAGATAAARPASRRLAEAEPWPERQDLGGPGPWGYLAVPLVAAAAAALATSLPGGGGGGTASSGPVRTR